MKREIFLTKTHLGLGSFLLHKSEIVKLAAKQAEKGYTLVPLQVYFKGEFSESGDWSGKR